MPIDLAKHREAFLSESSAHLSTIERVLVELEKHPKDKKLLHLIFRATHTLKSLAETMHYSKTGNLCHCIEDVLSAISQGKLELNNCSDLLFASYDHLKANLAEISKNEPELDPGNLPEQLENILQHRQPKNSTLKPKIDTQTITSVTQKVQSIEVKVEQLDALMNIAEELIATQMHFNVIQEATENPELDVAIESFNRLITELQYRIMQMRLVPIEFVFNRFIRMTRDLAKQQRKIVNLEIQGNDLELDRLLIDEIGESIAHLVRNSIDHGIETPQERKKANKPEAGTLQLSATRTKETAVIEIKDDGRGLDLAEIKKIALRKGLISDTKKIEDIKNLIFSEISTKSTVTELSGRGLGLPIVKQKMESIGGDVRVESIPGKMTAFYMEVPLNLAIIKCLFVRVAGSTYAIPIENVERLLTVNADEFKGLMHDQAIIFQDYEVPIIRLGELFDKKNKPLSKQPVVIVAKNNKRLGLAVDSLQAIQEIIIKPLSRPLKKNKLFSGAAVISSGQMILIVDVAFLLRNPRIADHESISRGLHATESNTQ